MNGLVPNYLYGTLTKVFHPTVFSLAQTTSPLTASLISSTLSIQTFPGFSQLLIMVCFAVGMFFIRNDVVINEAETIEFDDALSVDSAADHGKENQLLQELDYLGKTDKGDKENRLQETQPNFVRDSEFLG